MCIRDRVLGALASCAGGVCFQCFCSCFQSFFGATLKQQVRLSYVLLTSFCILVSLLILWYAAPTLSWFVYFIECPEASGGADYCLGISSIYRMSLALSLFYLYMILMMTCKNQVSRSWNEGGWFAKIVIVFLIFFGLMFVPNKYILYYAEVSQYFGVVFILFQIVMWVDLFYSWGEKWIAYYDESREMQESCWKYSIIITTVLMYAGSIYLIIMSFKWFNGEGCSDNVIKIVTTIVIIILIAILTVLRFAQNASLLTSGAGSLFICYLLWSALSSDPNTTCNALGRKKSTLIIEQVLGFVILLLALIYVTITSQQETSGNLSMGNTNIAAGLVDKETKNDGEGVLEEGEADAEAPPRATNQAAEPQQQTLLQNNGQGPEGADSYKSNYHIAFHFIMLLSSMYVLLLLTNWGNANYLDRQLPQYASASTAHRVKLGYLWTYSALFIWSLIAPKICPGRDFQ
eukprot:TRINITY_DN204_c0_g1_i3.p1 TRINITY_DN204_c0_g1~~TRINITY_DN204_c0_g1_i3.p1  ORF type:complete len:461 (-),score=20.80 TRINITY_DN204_c0_g1_i3:103-1485(-)